MSVEATNGAPASAYLSLARLDHWSKNIFVLPGVFLAYAIDSQVTEVDIFAICLAVFATCLAASANYTINEYLDRETDKHHPVKSQRASVQWELNPKVVTTQYVFLLLGSIFVAGLVNQGVVVAIAVLLVMGVLYNVQPARLKDVAFLDVLTESLNNPIRMMIGWIAVSTIVLPPATILLSYWFGGAFLMAAKRYAEYRAIEDRSQLANYRKSFANYPERRLLLSCIFYAQSSCFLFGAFIMKYRVEMILLFPLIAVLFCWYLLIAMRPENSHKVTIEEFYNYPAFVIFFGFFIGVAVLLTVVDIPFLAVLTDHTVLSDTRYNW